MLVGHVESRDHPLAHQYLIGRTTFGWACRLRTVASCTAPIYCARCPPPSASSRRSQLLGPLEGLDLQGIGWLIAGGESGPHHRPVLAEWLRALRDQCLRDGMPFFFKQWGGATSKAGGRILDNQEWSEMPRVSRSYSPSGLGRNRGTGGRKLTPSMVTPN